MAGTSKRCHESDSPSQESSPIRPKNKRQHTGSRRGRRRRSAIGIPGRHSTPFATGAVETSSSSLSEFDSDDNLSLSVHSSDTASTSAISEDIDIPTTHTHISPLSNISSITGRETPVNIGTGNERLVK